MALTRKTQSAVPPGELVRLRDHLAPYGCSLWDPEGEAILVLRVPGNEPDLVNDLEEASEYVGPELADAKTLLLVGSTGSTMVPTDILAPIVAQRRRRDQEFAKAVRPVMKPGTHRLMPAPGDMRRLPRLVIRLARPNVAATEDADWDRIALDIGQGLPTHANETLEPALAGVRFVHVVADHDELRLDADLVLRDLEQRWGNELERRRLAAEAAAMLAPQESKTSSRGSRASPLAAPQTEPDRGEPVASGRLSSADRAAMSIRRATARLAASPRRTNDVNWEAREDAPTGSFDVDAELESFRRGRAIQTGPAEPTADAFHRAIQQQVDATVGAPEERPARRRITGSRHRTDAPATDLASGVDQAIASAGLPVRARVAPSGSASTTAEPPSSSTPRRSSRGLDDLLQGIQPVQILPPAKPAVVPDPPGIQAFRERLVAAGYDVAPRAPEGVAMAAERDRHPGRILAFAPAKLDLATATKVLEQAKRLDADVAFVVCSEADQEAKERFIATRGRWVSPDAVASLVLA